MNFEQLSNAASSVSSLSDFIVSHISEIHELSRASYQEIESHNDSLERFILFKSPILRQLDYRNKDIRVFVLLLLDLCERLDLEGAAKQLSNIIETHEIPLNSRQVAGLISILNRTDATSYIKNLPQICALLQRAINEEDDNDTQALITFLTFYANSVDILHLEKLHELQNDILSLRTKYDFLNKHADIIEAPINDTSAAYELIHNRIDTLQNDRPKPIITATTSDFLIEQDTTYSNWLQSQKCSFDLIRQYAVTNATQQQLLGRGVDIIQDEQLLYNYLRSYGPMHKAKIESAFQLNFPQSFESKVDIIDWGCGQGVASMLFIEKYGAESINSITLIEPSVLAIKRAALHCHQMCPNANIITINKLLDDLDRNDFKHLYNNITIHLFSNILDIQDYSVGRLLNLMDSIKVEKEYYVCVSPYIDEIRSNRIEHFINHFTSSPNFLVYHDTINTKTNEFWECNNTFRTKRNCHGEFRNCNGSFEPCWNRWTRILKVFKA